MAVETYHFRLGNINCTLFVEMNRESPADEMYASVPENERAAVLAEFGLTENVPSAMNVLYMDTGNHKVLFDAGLGHGALYDGLAAEGIAHESIDQVIITHGHGDHIGGLINDDDQLVFPNAHYWVGKTEWESWDDPGHRTADLRKRLMAAIPANRVTLLETETEFLPGFTPMFLPGHCVGMMGVVVKANGEGLVHIADVMHHVIQVKYPDWCVHFDADKPQARQSRRKVLARAAAENLLVVSYHVWKSGRGYIKPDGDTWTWQAVTD